jgi:CsoR family transcriptional regulator, copper-sensing transcriptional repressor
MVSRPQKDPARSGRRTVEPDGRKTAPASACGCAVSTSERKAVGVDPGIKAQNLNRLRRIEGQVRGLQRLVEEDRYCADILTQISSVQEALRAVGRQLLRNHLRHCVRDAVVKGPAHAEPVYDELLQLFDRHL